MINKTEFLSLCGIDECELEKIDMRWEDLEAIAETYDKNKSNLKRIGRDFLEKILMST